jgi:ABC-type antimicrobial peptide transport system ATPase subunit
MENESKIGNIKELPMEMQRVLNNIDFPATRNKIIEQERKSRPIPDILQGLGMLPDREYTSAEEVATELHKIYMGVPA